jgi:hypothetical protein
MPLTDAERQAIADEWNAEEALRPEREALAQRVATDRDELLQSKLDAAVMALVDATPSQLITYARNNFPTLTLDEKNRMGAILHILAVAVRPAIRS